MSSVRITATSSTLATAMTAQTNNPSDVTLLAGMRSGATPAGHDGYLSSEWEGHMYSNASGFDMIAKHQALCRRVLARAAGA
jgi:hypothetical protein